MIPNFYARKAPRSKAEGGTGAPPSQLHQGEVGQDPVEGPEARARLLTANRVNIPPWSFRQVNLFTQDIFNSLRYPAFRSNRSHSPLPSELADGQHQGHCGGDTATEGREELGATLRYPVPSRGPVRWDPGWGSASRSPGEATGTLMPGKAGPRRATLGPRGAEARFPGGADSPGQPATTLPDWWVVTAHLSVPRGTCRETGGGQQRDPSVA